MAYEKLPRVIQDFGLGYQTVNQAADNAEDLMTAWDAEHGADGAMLTRPPRAGFGAPTLGQHDDVKIPRAVAIVKHSAFTYAPGQTSHSVWFELQSSTGVLLSVSRIGQGFYFFPTSGLDNTNVWVEVQPEANGTAVRMANARYASTLNGAPQPGIAVLLRELAGGAFGPADYGFTLTVFSDRQ